MNQLRTLFLFSLASVIIGCQTQQKEASQEIQNPELETTPQALSIDEQKGQELLAQCLQAHGGLENWRAFEALSYNLDDNGKMVYQITNLHDRRAYLKSENYEVGFDGHVAWAKPDAKQVSGGSAAFYYNLDFYFVGIPFLLKDPGVHSTYAGTKTINGKAYEALKITFGEDVGFTPDDVYYLYIDPDSHILQILTYSITYFRKEGSGINSAKVYSEWKETQGLLIPGKMENFSWKDGEIGESKNHLRLFSDVKFLLEIPDENIFNVPEGAITEKISSTQ